MTIYQGPVFEMARQQFLATADYLSIPEDQRNRLLYPNAPSLSLAQSTSMMALRPCSMAIGCNTISRLAQPRVAHAIPNRLISAKWQHLRSG